MKNLIATTLLLITMSLLLVTSCKKQVLNDYSNQMKDDLYAGKELISNEKLMLKALSKWIARSDSRQWILDKRGYYRSPRRLGEILILEIVSSSIGENLVETYNAISGATYTIKSFSDYIASENKMLSLKFDYFFEPHLGKIDNNIPLVSNQRRNESYLEGKLFDVDSVLTLTGANLALDFRLVEASNIVLYDPVTNTFNQELAYPFCREDLFTQRGIQLPRPLSTGEIPLSITEDVQKIFYDFCGVGLGGLEICDNGIDDDGDGLIDGDDPDCVLLGDSEICDNGIDDDGDGLIDGDDPDCSNINTSPCMRDHYLEDNFFNELELQSPQALTGMGGNLCNGVIDINPTPSSQGATHIFGNLYNSDFSNLEGLEEWYDFLIKVHWGTSSGSAGQFQDLVYRIHVFDLSNEPEFHTQDITIGSFGTPSYINLTFLFVDVQGLTETKPISLNKIPFFRASDVCGINNWDPASFGDQVSISVHEFDNCTLQGTDGTTTTSTTTNTYSSNFTINLGIGDSLNGNITGGILYTNENTLATTETNTITSSYQTNYSNDYYLGKINYSYCWSDQGINGQTHNIQFGNLIEIRTLVEICN